MRMRHTGVVSNRLRNSQLAALIRLRAIEFGL